MKLVAIGAKCRQRMRETVAAGARARAAQQSAFERGDRYGMRARRRAQPQQGMLEQRQQGYWFEAAERGLRRQPCEDAGRRVGQ